MSTPKLSGTAPSGHRSAEHARSVSPARVAVAGLIGTTIEWFDFLIYGTAAALVFGPQFFPNTSQVAGTLAAFSTFAVGFLARPVGAALMGHLGDRIGRKRMLITSLLLMGGGTAAIGLLPTYEVIGVAAPALLVALRLLQGVGVGGEWGGAVLMALEHAPPNRRTLYASFPQMGLPLGVILASLSFLPLRLSLDPDSFASWGWRIPFLVSALLVIFGLVLRTRLDESPEFVKAREARDLARAPLGAVVRRMPGTLGLAAGVSIAGSAFGNIFLVFSLSYATSRGFASPSAMLAYTIVAATVWVLLVPAGAALANRIGRRKAMLVGQCLAGLWAFPFFWMLETGAPTLILLGAIGWGVGQGIAGGPQAAIIADAFPAPLRYTGAGIAYATSGILGGGLAPLVATSLTVGQDSAVLVAAYVVALYALSFLCVALLRGPDYRIAPHRR